MNETEKRGAVLVVGAGDATGTAIARRFAREGHVVCMARRNGDQLAPHVAAIEAEGGRAIGYSLDARREEPVIELFDRIEREVGPLEVVVFNVGGNIRHSILEYTAKRFFKVWEMACFGGFLVGREAARRMVPRGHGTILFTGATASMRGGSGYAGFSAGKAGLRMLAQSMARELGPQGIHVAHVVVDGPIDTVFTRENFPAIYEQRDRDGVLQPDDIAENYWMLHRQPKSAWTFELDLRPSVEPW